MSRSIGFSDIREWQSLTNGARNVLGYACTDFDIELQNTTLSDVTQLTELVNLLNVATQKYQDVGRRDTQKMRIACERMQERDAEIGAAWGSGR